MNREYRLGELHYSNLVLDDPIVQLAIWLAQAERLELQDHTAMALATAGPEGHPSCRTVLLQDWDERGIHFYTNYESRKAKEIMGNPFAAGTLYWKELERQVCLEGPVEKMTEAESDDYFFKRPRESQIGAWASKQDTPTPSREALDEAFRLKEEEFKGKSIPRPPYWGGFRLIPHRMEFWQGRTHRLHDRFSYILENGLWKVTRLDP